MPDVLITENITGEEMEQLIRRAYSAPKALVQKAIEFNGGAQ